MSYMSRFYVPTKNIGEREILIDGEEAHHVIDVMRLSVGDNVVIFDGTGTEYSGSIKKIDGRDGRVSVEITSSKTKISEDPVHVTLAQAIPKKGKMDYIVEKATELGVSCVIPLLTERTIVRPDEAGSGKKTSRWHKIAVEAAKQCGRSDVPDVKEVTFYKDLVRAADGYDLCLLACLTDTTVPLRDSLLGFKAGRVLVLIGPEGDFSPAEMDMMSSRSNCRSVTLGPRVLKSDTAGLFVLAVLDYEFSKPI